MEAPIQKPINNPLKKRVDEMKPQTVEVPPQPSANVSTTDRELDSAIKHGRKENDLIAVNAGQITWNIITSDVAKIGLWKIIGAAASLIMWYFKNKGEVDAK